jgi:hypothetical protein
MRTVKRTQGHIGNGVMASEGMESWDVWQESKRKQKKEKEFFFTLIKV